MRVLHPIGSGTWIFPQIWSRRPFTVAVHRILLGVSAYPAAFQHQRARALVPTNHDLPPSAAFLRENVSATPSPHWPSAELLMRSAESLGRVIQSATNHALASALRHIRSSECLLLQSTRHQRRMPSGCD
ncbi:hypothetical protein NUU61_003804 [Penicillium alfredii]|uniref:Uncharacterized protein n=1 Tax=Penicillium alfredii TaxID=1506179 RepID=A0A9W9KE12_9EURO|nr:uncharacterized protein NUU61_003804 [Penicillium alfredii]KAJ5101582.1 hypothetical protein NUU61_003804 [Penicillium alfredii]